MPCPAACQKDLDPDAPLDYTEAMPDDSDPPRKFYTMKPREIERLNPERGQASAQKAIRVEDHLKSALPRPAPRSPQPPPLAPVALAPTATAPSPSAPSVAPPEANVVHLLQANTAREIDAGILGPGLDRPRRPSRRKRDYLLLASLGNGFIALLVAAGGINSIWLVLCLSAFMLFNVSTWWIMWVLMDDY